MFEFGVPFRFHCILKEKEGAEKITAALLLVLLSDTAVSTNGPFEIR